MQDYKVGIACVNGTTWLTGQVSNDRQLKIALAIAEQTEGVQRIVSRLLCQLTIDVRAIKMIRLRHVHRATDNVSDDERTFTSRRNQHALMSGRVARRRISVQSGSDVRLAVDKLQSAHLR